MYSYQKSIIIFSLCFLFSCTNNRKKYNEFINPNIDYNYVRTNSLLIFTKEISESSKIGFLKNIKLKKGEKRIRIWNGFGVIRPDFMLELQIMPNVSIGGKFYVYYDVDLSYMEEDEKDFKESVSSLCDKILIQEENNFLCEAKFKYEPKWNYVYKKLLKNNIFNLIDQSNLPKSDFIVLDGFGLVVEVKDENNYRTYEYTNPGFVKGREEFQALSIQGIISDLISKLYHSHK